MAFLNNMAGFDSLSSTKHELLPAVRKELSIIAIKNPCSSNAIANTMYTPNTFNVNNDENENIYKILRRLRMKINY